MLYTSQVLEIVRNTVHAAKCYDQSRLITWNFESHVTFLRGFCVDITRKYREFCVERGDRTWNSATLAWLPAWKRLTVSVKKIICRIILPLWMNIALRLECYSTAAFRKVLIFFWNARKFFPWKIDLFLSTMICPVIILNAFTNYEKWFAYAFNLCCFEKQSLITTLIT